MAEYEPDDSRVITNNPSRTPIEPERTGPKEGETRISDKEGSAESNGNAKDQRENDRWQVNEEAQRERLESGSTGQDGAGDAGRDPTRPE